MEPVPARCLILACGNMLRSDDGVGPSLAEWAEERFRDDPNVRVIARQQWTPDLAQEIAHAGSVLFIDCSLASLPGSIKLMPVEAPANEEWLATHHQTAAGLLRLARDLYASEPHDAQLLTIGAGSTELGEVLSDAVSVALPEACRILDREVLKMLTPSSQRK